jgi:hypothetical protein
MKNVIKKIIKGMGALLLTLPVVANAHYEACEYTKEATTHINYVVDAINEAKFAESRGKLKKNSSTPVDQANLLLKAQAALAYVAEGKYGDAASKLEGIVAKLDKLLNANPSKMKIDPDGGQHIVDDTVDASYCVVDLSLND